MADDFSDIKSLAEMAVEYLDLLTNSTQQLITAQTENTEYLNLLVDTTKEQTKASKDNTKATKEESNAKKLGKLALSSFKDIVYAAGRELINVGNAGTKLAESLGTNALRGTQLEVSNRKVLLSQLSNLNVDLAVTMEQLNAAQTGFADAFVGLREGTQISAQGTLSVITDLKKGFKSEFTPTAETFRILTQMGITTATQMDAFRRASGRASLSAGQLATLYNKNTLSFLLYGNSFGKAAVQAEKLGINLASIQAAQEGLVTNLDGTIDTVAQLNQLGAQIDFGELVRIAETEGPDALMAYVRATVPEQLMQSASTRSLFKQLGISVEEYLKSGEKQISAAEQLEKRMTEAATEAGGLARSALGLSRRNKILEDSLGELYTAVKNAVFALGEFVAQLAFSAIGPLLSSLLGSIGLSATAGFASAAAGAATVSVALIGAAIGLSIGEGINRLFGLYSFADRRRDQEIIKKDEEAQKRFDAEGSARRNAIARTKGYNTWEEMVAARTGTGQPRSGPAPRVDDMISPPRSTRVNDIYSGYGERVLATPTATYALNNKDTVIAGTNLFRGNDVLSYGEGALSVNGGSNRSDTTALIRKVDALITALSTANTTISVGGGVQTVPRLQLVGVYDRAGR